MRQRPCSCQSESPRYSRRTALQATAGMVATVLASPGFGPTMAAAQDATPAPPAGPDTFPDLTGVQPLPLTGVRLATFEAYVAAKLAEIRVPGAAVAVVQNGEVAFLQGFGVREMGRSAPVSADTILRIGSVTKSFSSLLAATLVDAGRLDWETPIVDLLPTFAVANPDLTPRLTVADAFCACTGMPRRDWNIVFNGRTLTAERVVETMADLPLTHDYGQAYLYSNQMVAVGGFAATVADGGSSSDLAHDYRIALKARVLDPIGMPRSTFSLEEVLADGEYAMPHGANITRALQPLPLLEDQVWIKSMEPSGGLWSTAREMARYVQTGLNRGVSPDGVRVVSEANLDRTWQPGVAMPPPAPGTSPALATAGGHYGLGWVVGTYGGQQLVWHGGATLGFHSLAMLLPESGLGMVILTNATVGVASTLTTSAAYRLLEIVFDLPSTIDAALEPGLTAVASAWAGIVDQLGEADEAEVAPFLGRYISADLGDATLSFQGGRLIFDIGELRSELRPRLGADGEIIDYVLTDPPLGGFPLELPVTLQPGADGQPNVLITVAAAPGDPEEVYTFEPD